MKKLVFLGLISLLAFSCSKKSDKKITVEKQRTPIQTPTTISKNNSAESTENLVKYIESDSEFEKLIERSDSVLLVFDLYADWCKPCKILSPVLEEISKEEKGKVEIYKVNVDKLPNISRAFGVRSIPLVVFMKEKKGVHSLVGVQPKRSYLEAIEKFSFKN